MPSRSSRRIHNQPPADDSGSESASSTSSHAPPSPPMAAAPLERSADPLLSGANSGDDAEIFRQDQSSSAAASSAEASFAFEPPDNLELARSRQQMGSESESASASAAGAGSFTSQRAIQIQTRNSSAVAHSEVTATAAASSPGHDSSPQADVRGTSPIHHARAAVAPPIVTKTTRRQTFESAISSRSSGKKKSGHSRSVLHPSNNSSPSSSSGEEDNSMMDLFSPPPPSSLRTRPRSREQSQQQQQQQQQHQNPIVDLTATVTTSASVDEPPAESHTHHHETSEESHSLQHLHPQHMEYAYESPPIYTPHGTVDEDEDTGQMAMSTSQKRQYQGLVVHVPKSREGGEPAPQGGYAAGGEATALVAGRSSSAEPALESAPARLPVSRHAAMASSDRPPDGSQDFASFAKNIDYDSNEDFNAALQLSFDDSPNDEERGHPSPSKKARTPSSSSQQQQQQHQHPANPASAASERYPPQQQQQQQQHQAYPYHPAYYPYHQGWASQGYPHYPPSTSPQGVPPHLPGYSPHPGQPPHGYPTHQWAASAHAGQQQGQHPGYYMYPTQHPPYQQQQQAQQHPQYQMPPPETPSGARTPSSKRKGKNIESNDTTMDTAELSYEEEMGGPISPPSSKKKKDALAAAWGSPPREFVRGPPDEEVTPQRGSTLASRSRSHERPPPPYYQYQTTTPHSTTPQFHELRPTPSAEIFPAESWSPSAMRAFFEEEGDQASSGNGGGGGPDGGNNNNASSFSSSPEYHHHHHEPMDILEGTADEEKMEGSPEQQRQGQPSPFHSVMSPTRGGITIRGSPISRKTHRGMAVAAAAPGPTRGGELPHSTPSRGDDKTAALKSPPRQSSWQTPSGTTAGMRVKIGSVGMETTEARRGIEGINSVLRGSPVSAPQKPSHALPGGLQPQPHSTAMRIDYGAPVAVSGGGYAPTPSQRGGPYKMPPPPPGSEIMMTPSAAAAAARRGTGKENAENDPSSLLPGGAQPCNCKKSKCLKLYCECFASENYCHGCKCTNCHNTPQYQAIRNKAIADTKAKNPNAFKEKMTQHSSHAMGCKCKKSACLKKYCECFQGGIVCGQKCKCINCKNFIGSQALIDRRRKIKDHKGAEIAMQSSEKAWKGSLSDTKVGMRSGSGGGPGGMAFGQSPIVHDPTRMPPGPPNWAMMSPLPTYGVASPATQQQGPQHHGGGRPHDYPAGYPAYPHAAGMLLPQQSPMVYRTPHHPPPYSASRAEGASRKQVQQQHRGSAQPQKQPSSFDLHSPPPVASTPRSASLQRGYHHQPSRRRQLPPPVQQMEPTAAYFGPDVEAQTKTAALNVFSYLTNDDLFNASIVSKKWCDVAFDKGLWRHSPSGGVTRL